MGDICQKYQNLFPLISAPVPTPNNTTINSRPAYYPSPRICATTIIRHNKQITKKQKIYSGTWDKVGGNTGDPPLEVDPRAALLH